ncbi:MAG: TRAP transporter substrate-binding protein DctP [Burkholderiaceae bacterium]|nr:TRAP transporter substrate-binding protein DctP [Burkholderiaceae bacterium]
MIGTRGKRSRKFLSAIAAAGLALSGIAQAQTQELKLQLYQGPQHLIVQKVKAISPDVERMTEGRVKISVFDSGTLAKGPQMFDAVEKGVVDIAAWSYAFASPKNMPFLMLGTFPFIYRDAAGYIDAWNDESLVRLANDYIGELGYRRVEIGNTFYVGFYQMAFKDREPKSPADLRGLKVRSLGSVMPFFNRYGISAVSVDTPGVYEGLERGIIDGAIGVYSNWVDWGWGEPATYLVDFNLAAVGLAFLVNKDSLAKLRPADRVIVDQYLGRLQNALNEEYLKADQTYRQVISAHLMKIYTPTADELAEWGAAREEVRKDWVRQVGERGAKALSVIEKYNGEPVYRKASSSR